ncbi:MAG: glutathione S-transferase family protein [Pseudomonadota bacterium]
MIELFGRASSSNVQMVHWALSEYSVPFNRHDVGENFGGLDTPEFLSMNPNGTIPVIKDGDMVLFESAAILRYLAENYGPSEAWPNDIAARARIDMWAEWAKQGPSNRFTFPVFWRVVRTPIERQNQSEICRAVDRFESDLPVADAQLAKNDWLAGDRMTHGDFILGHVLFRYFTIKIDRRDFPYVRAYYDRLCRRPAYQKTVMLDYSELYGTV